MECMQLTDDLLLSDLVWFLDLICVLVLLILSMHRLPYLQGAHASCRGCLPSLSCLHQLHVLMWPGDGLLVWVPSGPVHQRFISVHQQT